MLQGQAGHRVGRAEGQRARADLDQGTRTCPAGGTLSQRAGVGDVDEAGARREEVDRAVQRETALPDAEDARVDVERGARRDLILRADDERAAVDPRRPGIGIGAGKPEGARARLDDSIPGAVTVRDDAGQGDQAAAQLAVGGSRHREDAGDIRCRRRIRKPDVTGKDEVGSRSGSVEGIQQEDVARHLDVIGDRDSVTESRHTLESARGQGTPVEDQRARPEGAGVSHLDRLTEVEDAESAMGIGLVQHDGAASSVRSDRGTSGAESHVALRAGQLTGNVEIQRAAAAAEAIPESGVGRGGEAGTVGDERPAGQRAGEIRGGGLGDAGRRIRAADAAEEGGAAAQGAEVGAYVVSDGLDAQYAAERTSVRAESNRGRSAHVTQREGTQTCGGADQSDARRRNLRGAGDSQGTTGIDRHRARTEGARGHARQEGNDAAVDLRSAGIDVRVAEQQQGPIAGLGQAAGSGATDSIIKTDRETIGVEDGPAGIEGERANRRVESGSELDAAAGEINRRVGSQRTVARRRQSGEIDQSAVEIDGSAE